MRRRRARGPALLPRLRPEADGGRDVMDDLYGFVPYLAAFIAFLGSAYLFTRGPKEGCFDSVAPIIQTAVTLATLGTYVGLLKVKIPPALWIPSLGVGIALGAYGSWRTTLELPPGSSLRPVS